VSDIPRLTVAIPSYNGSRYLADALRGILAQEGADFDLLVCDDRSDDDTPSLIRSECGDRARIEINSERLGLAGNWNRCVERSRTEWVAIFHQDDQMLPGHLAAHLEAISQDNDQRLGLVAGPAYVIDDEGRFVPSWIVEPGGEIVLPTKATHSRSHTFPPPRFSPFLVDHNPLRCSAVTTRRSAHSSVGGFDPNFRYVVDWDFWCRVARRWSVAWTLGEPTLAVRWHSESETHRFKKGTDDLDETARLLEQIFREDAPILTNLRSVKRTAHHRLARAYLNRAYDAAHGAEKSLARLCLRRSLRLWPGILGKIVSDPRLMIRLALGAI
jgi:glycosyltransferase involved in cell wall biosynthesis